MESGLKMAKNPFSSKDKIKALKKKIKTDQEPNKLKDWCYIFYLLTIFIVAVHNLVFS